MTMAAVDIRPHFGAELKDGFKPVNAWVSTSINWLEDVQAFYRERAAIEKDYSGKLSALAKKYYEKKAKKSTSLSVGDTPTLTPGSLESASVTTWTTQLSTLERRAAEHDRFSIELQTQLADPLKNAATRFEELRKSHVEYSIKLEKEKDTAFVALKRVKGQYDGACQEVENRRKKVESSFDMSKQKSQNAYQQQLVDMHNVKNTYLVHINVTNKQKEKYYHEYVPELIDSLQDLSETRVNQVNSVWLLASKIESETLRRSLDHMQFLTAEIPRNEPKLDSMMFLRHNMVSWQEPPDVGFEPSPVWHDDAAMVTDETAKIFLRNILGKSKAQRSEFKREFEAKRKELESMRRTRKNVQEGKDRRDEVEVVRAIFFTQEALHQVERKWLTAEVETSTITSVVGDISLGAQNHNFRSQTFKIPTMCDLCGERIWGLSAKGFDCRDCGYTCHSKCELKVPADCPGEQSKEDKRKLKLERQTATDVVHSHVHTSKASEGALELPALNRSETMTSLSSGYAASAHRSVSGASAKTDATTTTSMASKPSTLRKNRVVAPPPTQYPVEMPSERSPDGRPRRTGSEPQAMMLYAYDANGDGEISVPEGQNISILEPDDGSGWLKVRAGTITGIVPASYVDALPPSTPGTSTLPIERPNSTHSNMSHSATSSLHAGSATSAPNFAAAVAAAAAGKKKGPAVAPKRGARKLHYVKALYDYAAQSGTEKSMHEGERFVLVKADAGDGWAEVEGADGRGCVPANYLGDA